MGKFEKGKPKTGGRQKGTPNKKQTMKERFEEAGFDPFAILMDMAKSVGKYEDPLRFAAAKELCQYTEPKLKTVELKNAEGEGFKIVIEDYSKETK